MHDRFAIIQQDLCKVERKVLEPSLATLTGGSNKYALNDLVGPRHLVTGRVVAYVTKCVSELPPR